MKTNYLVVLVCFLFIGISKLSAQKQRPLKVDDLFNIESMGVFYGGPYSFSNDGEKFAFTRTRGQKTSATYNMLLGGNEGADIFVQYNASKDPINITNGIKDGSSWWAPEWSPDGKKLAFLSTRGGDDIYLWIWNAASHQLKQLSKRSVDIRGEVNKRPFEWINSEKIVFSALPNESLTASGHIYSAIANEWNKSKKGIEPGVSMLESGKQVDLSKLPNNDLLLVDIKNETCKVILHSLGPNFYWELSPKKNYIVYSNLGRLYQPVPGKFEDIYSLKSGGDNKIGIAKIDGEILSLKGEVNADILIGSAKWANDESSIAFFGFANETNTRLLYVLNLDTKIITKLQPPNLDLSNPNFVWTDNKLMLQAPLEKKDTSSKTTYKRDWWLISAGEDLKNITNQINIPPFELFSINNGKLFVGASEGEILLLNPSDGSSKSITSDFEDKVASISFATSSQIIFCVKKNGNKECFYVDIKSGLINKISLPDSTADLVAFEPVKGTVIFSKSDNNGLMVWRGGIKESEAKMLVEANLFKKDIAKNRFEKFQYTSQDGEELTGWIMLPVDYQKGKRYPTISWVYATETYEPDFHPSIDGDYNYAKFINMQIPAAQGYAILFPSMPLEPGQDAFMRLTNGVTPAIDKAIEMGIADPKRLFVMGQSFGGFSTMGLVTQVKRFNAAVAIAGPSNFMTLYNQFHTMNRYSSLYQEAPISFFRAEGSIYGGGPNRPPWEDFLRYIRNSPIFYVDRVETPIMIIQGDMDGVPIQQGEEFFNSLYRQNKKAALVRYWGDYHSIISPGNIRDMWSRIFSWFDESGDIKRDDEGNLVWDGDKVMSRNGAPAWEAKDFLKFSRFFDQDWGK